MRDEAGVAFIITPPCVSPPTASCWQIALSMAALKKTPLDSKRLGTPRLYPARLPIALNVTYALPSIAQSKKFLKDANRPNACGRGKRERALDLALLFGMTAGRRVVED